MNILSCFDGISCGQVALNRSGIIYDHYFASEIDKYAISITQKNYPRTVQLGDVNNWRNWRLPQIDLLLGGSPCTGFSRAGDGLNFEDPQSKLFFIFIDILKFYKPRYFLLENVKMKPEWRDKITEIIGVEPILINSSLVSAQNRQRLYWTNIPNVTQPEDKHLLLKDIILSGTPIDDKARTIDANYYKGGSKKDIGIIPFKNLRESERRNQVLEIEDMTIMPIALHSLHNGFEEKKDLVHSQEAVDYMNREVADGRNHWDFAHFSDVKGVPYNVFKDWDCIRKFHPIECERLQTIPDSYSAFGIDEKGSVVPVSATQRYKAIGNGWTVDVISHILEGLKP